MISVKKYSRAICAAGLAFTAAAGLLVQTAHAAPAPPTQCVPTSGGLLVCLSAELVQVPSGGGTSTMAATCTATVEGAAETTQVGCQIQSPVTGDAGNAPNVILDGPTAVTAVAVTGTPLTAYTITVSGQYTLAPFNAPGGSFSATFNELL